VASDQSNNLLLKQRSHISYKGSALPCKNTFIEQEIDHLVACL